LLFSIDAHRQVIEAYMGGLEDRLAAGKDIAGIASVASFFVSRVDSEVDKRLDAIAAKADPATKDRAMALKGRAAVANAQLAYQLFRETGLTFGVFGTTKTYPPDVAPGPWTTAFSKWSSWDLLTGWTFYETMISRLWLLHLTPPGLALSAIGILLWRRVPGKAMVDSWALGMLAFILAAGYGQMGHDYYQLPLVAICAFYFAAAARNASSLRATITTRAPSRTNAAAAASPMPRDAPVTIATLPSSWRSITPLGG